MHGPDVDLAFPECCTCCPYLRAVKASCQHDLSQSLIHELDTDTVCPIYSHEKTKAMDQLADA